MKQIKYVSCYDLDDAIEYANKRYYKNGCDSWGANKKKSIKTFWFYFNNTITRAEIVGDHIRFYPDDQEKVSGTWVGFCRRLYSYLYKHCGY
jgi:hypothetical protein